jgi:hypothetical protein
LAFDAGGAPTVTEHDGGPIELAFHELQEQDYANQVAVSAQREDGVLLNAGPAECMWLSVDVARRLASQLVEAAAWVEDGSAGGR